MTDSSKTTNQSQTSSTSPWAPAMPLVNSLISQYGGLDPSVTAAQGGALSNLQSALSAAPNFGAQGAGAVNNLFSSNSSPQVGMLQSAYDTMKTNLTPTASGANLDPYSTPGFGDAIRTAINDTTNQVKGVYAGSGRDPSGAGSFAGSLGRGITQGISPTIANQYNQNYSNFANANNALLTGAGTTATGITGLRQNDLNNGIAGITAGMSIPGLYGSPAAAQYAAANQAYAQPYQNLAQLLQPSAALAGLGSTSTGTGNSTQISTPSLLDSLKSGTQLGGSWISGAGAAASALPALLALSDVRAKEDIAKVGELADGKNVYSYRYRGSPRTEIGLLAQEVERDDPGAVVEVGGLKHVNYARAVAPSLRGRVGALREAA